LQERLLVAHDLAEYCAALPTAAVYNVHLKPHVPFYTPDQFMSRRLRGRMTTSPASPMRYARPGERPPSTRPPGTRDDAIDRLDVYAARLKRGERVN
jgi:hypothetical protein